MAIAAVGFSSTAPGAITGNYSVHKGGSKTYARFTCWTSNTNPFDFLEYDYMYLACNLFYFILGDWELEQTTDLVEDPVLATDIQTITETLVVNCPQGTYMFDVLHAATEDDGGYLSWEQSSQHTFVNSYC